MKKAYLRYTEMEPEVDDVKVFEKWRVARSAESVVLFLVYHLAA